MQASTGTVLFRVWAPNSKNVNLILEGSSPCEIPMQPDQNGYFQLETRLATPGSLYRYRLEDGNAYPDPASRFQPEGAHGPSQVVDGRTFKWTDEDWKGIELSNQVLYEMHIGTFTREGTWKAALKELPELAEVGITCLEVMPVNEFAGKFGWGYDGVSLYAPTRLYGTPEDFREFVNEAHRLKLGVILDVVYNHLGPDGNYLPKFSPDYFSKKHKTDWGEAINFDGENCQPVRDFFTGNAGYWIEDFHLDGLRLDATQNIYDNALPEKHILTEIGRTVRRAAQGRSTIIVSENESQHSELVRSIETGGYGLDGLWNDDFHHSASVALTGHQGAYYKDYRGEPQEFISAIKYGYLYQGQWYSWQNQKRGHAGLDLPPSAFINYLENHDQVANSGRGLRMHQMTSPGRYRAIKTVTLLGPGTPMLFQGEEFASSSPFFYFADHHNELAPLVERGRKEFLSQFRNLRDTKMKAQLAAPHNPATFERCKLNFYERFTHEAHYRLTKDLLKLRKLDLNFNSQRHMKIDGAVLGPQAFVLRYIHPEGLDRILLVNLGRDWDLQTCPEPLLAAPWKCEWELLLSTDSPSYGGSGVFHPETETGWLLAAESATLLGARRVN
ncbi:malto-oligosyltrehalose trehalohydrolase [Telmatocola sphagniphila]|uniref:Malto-oligosyltrehalose trehalohydrolase n=1 Tax=Telmatocola sphagniphila TaxID=1123043 RepID=A0A8E6B7G8_9BACT|nr:malto-oligosyltrehalose trehalohydrolase [Telmatocola sphagniphila]